MLAKVMKVLFLSGAVLFFWGCVSAGTSTQVQTTKRNLNEAVRYNGPKARIAVASFKCKAAKCWGEVGEGIKDMLVDALVRTNRFVVLERGEGFEEVQQELERVRGKDFKKTRAPKGGNLEGADILVVGAITAFEPNAGGVKGGIGGLVGGLLGVGLGTKEAYIAANIRLIDVRTGRIINSTRVEGKASSFKLRGVGGGLLGDVPLGAGLEIYKNTPMEKAIMVMIDNAVQEIVKLVPEEYYRVN